jgi:flagellin-like protein
MKANQKFLKSTDDAVSPVIAVILMVAITVVLAATVYVWVSGFGSSTSSAQKSMSLVSAGSISNNNKNYTVASATPGMKWTDLTFTMDGSTYAYHGDMLTVVYSGNTMCVMDASAACAAGSTLPSTTVDAGDTVSIITTTGLSGHTLRVLDANANAVVLTLTVG